ncbi:TIR-NBS-LRR RCT1 resistance protein, partial [Trifolium medium]|nr:TIR-NBS-LRR RCT1 resistance protein [Trifolium medium]
MDVANKQRDIPSSKICRQVIPRFLDVLKATICQNSEASTSSTTSQVFDDTIGQVRTSGSMNHLKSLIIQMGTKCQDSNIAEDSVSQ